MRRESRSPLLSLERGLSLPLGGSEAEVGRSLGSPLLCGGGGGAMANMFHTSPRRPPSSEEEEKRKGHE